MSSGFHVPGLSPGTDGYHRATRSTGAYETLGPLQALYTAETGSGLSDETGSNRLSVFYPTEGLAKIDHWVTFRAFKFQSISPMFDDKSNTSAIKKPLSFITLPLPPQLSTGYQANYEGQSLEYTGVILAQGAGKLSSMIRERLNQENRYGDVRDARRGSVWNTLKATGSALGELVTGAKNDAKAADIAAGVASILTAGAGTTGKAIMAQGVGVARNPYQALLYAGTAFRRHRFSWRLAATSRADSIAIQDIITRFKYFMSGRYGLGRIKLEIQNELARRAFVEYPEYFEIDFHHPEFLFNIGSSVLVSMNVNYHPENYPAYVRSADAPAQAAPLEVALDLEFEEREIVTKEDIVNRNR